MSRSPSTSTGAPLPAAAPRSLRHMPKQMGRAIGITWSAAPRPLVALGVLQVLSGAGSAALVLVAKQVLSVVLGQHGPLTLAAALPSVLLLGLVTVVMRLISALTSELSRLMSGRVEASTISQMSAAAAAADLLDYERPEFHDHLQRAQMAATSRPIQMVQDLTSTLGALTGIVGIGAALISLAPPLAALLAFGAVPVWLASRQASRMLREFSLSQTAADRQRHYLFLVLSHRDSAAEVRAMSLAPWLRGRLSELYHQRLTELGSLVRRRIVVTALGSALSAALTLATLVLLVWMVSRGHLALSAAGAAAGAVVLLGERLHGLGGGSGSLYEQALYMADYTSFIQGRLPPGGAEPVAPGAGGSASGVTAPPVATSSRSLPQFERLVADDLWFTYPNRSTPALRGLSVEIGQAEVVALVGENGSGKTTLAKILAGLYQPSSGQVLWDGTPLAELDAKALRRSIAVVFQEYGQYLMSAADNIALGDTERREDRGAVEAAARQAGAHRFIESLPHGYDNLLGSQYVGGADLSVGQWQRIALARAFFRDAPFIILDEPTASLDARAEADLFAHIRTLFDRRAVLLVSHRFASVRSADRIYMLDHGVVAEAGTHQQLIALGGRYAELYELQASAFLDDPGRGTASAAGGNGEGLGSMGGLGGDLDQYGPGGRDERDEPQPPDAPAMGPTHQAQPTWQRASYP